MIAMVNAIYDFDYNCSRTHVQSHMTPLRKNVSLYDKRKKKPLKFVTFYLK